MHALPTLSLCLPGISLIKTIISNQKHSSHLLCYSCCLSSTLLCCFCLYTYVTLMTKCLRVENSNFCVQGRNIVRCWEYLSNVLFKKKSIECHIVSDVMQESWLQAQACPVQFCALSATAHIAGGQKVNVQPGTCKIIRDLQLAGVGEHVF